MPTSARLLCIYKIRMILPLQTNSMAAVQAEMLHTASMVANGRMWDSEPTGAVMIRCTIKKRTCPWLPL